MKKNMPNYIWLFMQLNTESLNTSEEWKINSWQIMAGRLTKEPINTIESIDVQCDKQYLYDKLVTTILFRAKTCTLEFNKGRRIMGIQTVNHINCGVGLDNLYNHYIYLCMLYSTVYSSYKANLRTIWYCALCMW